MNDKFFLDDDVIISFDDNMIEEIIPNVSVVEERFKEDSILRLNKDQIKAEVTNLVIDKYKSNAILKSKVANYTNLFFQFPQVSQIKIKNVKPIIYADKLVYFNSEDDHNQNKEYEKSNFQKSDKLGNFISQFHSLNRDMSKQSSILSANKLYALYAPFASRDDNDTFSVLYKPEKDEDALRHCFLEDFECDGSINDTVRLISKVDINKNTVYDGDFVNIIGFYNIVNNNTKIKVVDIQKYIDSILSLDKGDKVSLFFNEPLLNKSGDILLKSTKGDIVEKTEDKIVIQLNKDVMFKNEIISQFTYYIKSLSNPFTIYQNTVSENDVYNKQMLVSHNIVFKFPNTTHYTIEDVLYFISPSSIGEVLLLGENNYKNIYNLQDLSDLLLSNYGIKLDDISIELHSFIKYILSHDKEHIPVLKRTRKSNVQLIPYHNTSLLTDFQKNKDLLKYYNYLYPSYDSYIDDVLNRFRYLRTQNDKGAYYVVSLIKKNVEKKYKKHYSQLTKFQKELLLIEQTLDKLQLPSSSETNTCESTYAKKYKKLDKLLDDNNKQIYFDKAYDKTKYTLKEGFSGSSDKELRMYLLNELTSQRKFKGLSKDEIDFEVKTIMKGKREVKSGDLCILESSSGDVVYVRKLIEDKPMWIKKFKTPFRICADSPLIKYDDLVQLDTCIKHTFDDVCKTNRNAKVLYKYRVLISLKNELTSVISLLEQYEKIQEVLDNDIEYFKRYTQIVPSEHKPNRDFEYVEHVDYEDYNGDEVAVGDVEYMIEFNEQNTFVVAPSSTYGTYNKVVLENQDVLNMFLSFLQLDLDENEKQYILNGINSKYPRKNITTKLQMYKEKLMNEVNKDAYKSSEKYMKMFDNIVKQKLDKIESELIKKQFFNIFRNIISMIIIFIFIRYPIYVMKRVHPSCVKFLSYAGYPITDNQKDAQKSLVAYMTCILVNVSVPEDIRFALFYEKDSNEIQKVLKDTIDELLEENYELRTQLQLTKSIIENSKEHQSQASTKEYNNLTSFKPSFKFGNLERMNKKDKVVVKFIKTIQDLVSSSKIAKQNGLNVPNLANACCNEKLIKDVDFFNFFENQIEFKNANKTVVAMKHVSFKDENMHPPSKHHEKTDLFGKFAINHTNAVSMEIEIKEDTERTFGENVMDFVSSNEIYQSNMLLDELSKNFESHDWWVDIFYPTFIEEIQLFESTINRVSNTIIKDDFEYIKDVIINVNASYEPSTVRHALHMFLSSKTRVILGKILNKQKLTEKMLTEESIKANPIYGIIASITNNKNYDSVIPKLRNTIKFLDKVSTLYMRTTDDDMIVKNISVLAFITFTFFNMLLINTLNNSDNEKIKDIIQITSPVEKDNIKITCDIVALLMSSLKAQLHNTIINNDLLKMSVEALREKRKQELINSYKVDEEERELQKQLKKLGLQNWADILTGEDDIVSEDVIASTKTTSIVKDEYEEEKDYVYSTYKGENADDDEVDEEYVSYENYDN
jgi:hypothetical protein